MSLLLAVPALSLTKFHPSPADFFSTTFIHLAASLSSSVLIFTKSSLFLSHLGRITTNSLASQSFLNGVPHKKKKKKKLSCIFYLHSLSHLDPPPASLMELIPTACIHVWGITFHNNVSTAYERVWRILLFLKPFFTSHEHTNILSKLSLMHNQCEFIIERMSNMIASLNIFFIFTTNTYSNTICKWRDHLTSWRPCSSLEKESCTQFVSEGDRWQVPTHRMGHSYHQCQLMLGLVPWTPWPLSAQHPWDYAVFESISRGENMQRLTKNSCTTGKIKCSLY